MTTETFQPRYVAYAKFHGTSPSKMLTRDSVLFPGGKMVGFILWISRNIADFKKISPQSFSEYGPLNDQESFTAYLENESRLPERCREFIESHLDSH
jgi:hypothetical protein